MATLTNRSRYTVSVTRRPDLTRTFPHTAEERWLRFFGHGYKWISSRVST